MRYQSIVVKVGTAVITMQDGFLNIGAMERIVEQIVRLKKKNVDLVLVSSGAVAAGRADFSLSDKEDDVSRRQVLASIGQVELINTYKKLFQKYEYRCAQVLATKSDFRDRNHYLNMQKCFEALNRNNIIPIVNENDVVSVKELMFTDNDELAGLIASMMDVDALLLLTRTDGVFDRNPDDKDAKVIPRVLPEESVVCNISNDKSTFGRGGMLTKCDVARKMSNLGITTHILSGNRENIITKTVKGEDFGTVFEPVKDKKVASIKRWLAHSDGHEKGVIWVDDGAKKVLMMTDNSASLLPIGISKFDGYFDKGDVIKIKDGRGNSLGLGRAEYSSDELEKVRGQKGKKPFIRCDFLYLYI